jgi:hypothetical protein
MTLGATVAESEGDWPSGKEKFNVVLWLDFGVITPRYGLPGRN